MKSIIAHTMTMHCAKIDKNKQINVVSYPSDIEYNKAAKWDSGKGWIIKDGEAVKVKL